MMLMTYFAQYAPLDYLYFHTKYTTTVQANNRLSVIFSKIVFFLLLTLLDETRRMVKTA